MSESKLVALVKDDKVAREIARQPHGGDCACSQCVESYGIIKRYRFQVLQRAKELGGAEI